MNKFTPMTNRINNPEELVESIRTGENAVADKVHDDRIRDLICRLSTKSLPEHRPPVILITSTDTDLPDARYSFDCLALLAEYDVPVTITFVPAAEHAGNWTGIIARVRDDYILLDGEENYACAMLPHKFIKEIIVTQVDASKVPYFEALRRK